MIKAHERSHHRFTGNTRLSPRNGFNGFLRALPGVPGLLATFVGGLLRRSDTSVGVSGPHDFAVRLSAIRQKRIRVHRIPPRVRDDRERPSVGRDGCGYRLICTFRKTEYFFGRGLTGFRKSENSTRRANQFVPGSGKSPAMVHIKAGHRTASTGSNDAIGHFDMIGFLPCPIDVSNRVDKDSSRRPAGDTHRARHRQQRRHRRRLRPHRHTSHRETPCAAQRRQMTSV